jgi:hypothetical protein
MTKVLDTVPGLPKELMGRMICTWLSDIDYAHTGIDGALLIPYGYKQAGALGDEKWQGVRTGTPCTPTPWRPSRLSSPRYKRLTFR